MRTTEELLELMLQHKILFYDGMCNWVFRLYCEDIIDWKEMRILHNLIYHHRKTPFLSIQDWWYKNPKNSGYFWEFGKITPRIHWIKYQIKQLNNL